MITWTEETRKLSQLKPFEANPRKITDADLERLVTKIKTSGYHQRIRITHDDRIIGGHQRLKALKKCGYKEVAVLVPDAELTDEEYRREVIQDNLQDGSWDIEALAEWDIGQLNDWGLDTDALGLIVEEPEIEGLTDEDAVPEAPEEPVSREGDIWLLGDHRVCCGDSTDAGTVALLMDGQKADMVFTDPPYNTGMTNKTQSQPNKRLGKKNGSTEWLSHMFDDSFTDEEWAKFISDFCDRYDEFTKDNSLIYICLDWRRSHELVPELKKRWKFNNLIVWDKMVHGLGSDYKYTHEFIHVCKKGKRSADNREGEKEYQDVWRIQRKMGRDEEHATKKPIELCERAIRHGSKYKESVLDLFGGSGSTLIAAEKNNRVAYLCELMPQYVDVMIKRWEQFTGKEAVHSETGKTYAIMAQERL